MLRWCATVLLVWTAVDMMAPGLCALEREHDDVAVAAVGAEAGAFDAAGGVRARVAPDETLPPAGDSTPAPHVDDCFCCSHCVDVWRLDAVAAPADLVRRFVVREQRVVDNVPPPPYHPPLA